MSQERVLCYPAGSVLVFTSGEYSSYGMTAVVATVVNCDLPELAKKFQAEGDEGREKKCVDDFVSWLVANGHVIPVSYSEVHLGEYHFRPEFTDAR